MQNPAHDKEKQKKCSYIPFFFIKRSMIQELFHTFAHLCSKGCDIPGQSIHY